MFINDNLNLPGPVILSDPLSDGFTAMAIVQKNVACLAINQPIVLILWSQDGKSFEKLVWVYPCVFYMDNYN